MLVLVVDSSTPAVTAALAEVSADGVALRASRCTVDARAHGELLAPQVDAVLADVGARPADLAAIVAGLGPGPFTGLRVGLVTAATMGQVLGAHPRTASARWTGSATRRPPGEPVLAASDARRREIYWAVYDGAASAWPGGGGAPAVGRGTGARAWRSPSRSATAHIGTRTCWGCRYATSRATRTRWRWPVARGAADPRGRARRETLTPLYLRRPDAVAATGHKPVLP
ncbi:tRNA (adenosine(37)-N6)-threonylcarbamoyltransferase complex dimerization subunit type 1 TsaB [Micromonospora sp. b486]|uniref:tRNA (adenosine(37)-N6)-threonylcarbamoyltransferase complex dimerization subunit type 1 TsaB n=1 Tax=Micromonospora sp. b486 TaxID=3053986 RepID=UPI00259D139E|nr:tRNA (adenosine(37)-N6)-threonylcarbamoyltransferase complex dimerization subunit type 1 TsaB [Micromonospora sp. b486]MDM4784396.1 tRNA (adenosine(37)-N6)-threonylcarbamoyltransferase complex dimerization subunit type 1 TsaB [Micromonospora sp. b486]